MHRLRLSHVPAILLALLFIAVASIWARSDLWGDSIDWTHGPAVLQIRSGAGSIALQRSPNMGWSPQGSIRQWSIPKPKPDNSAHLDEDDERFWDRWTWSPHHKLHFAGFNLSFAPGLIVRNYPGSQTFWIIQTPYWFWLLVTTLIPAARILRRRARKNKSKKGICPVCGYDLRATPNRCPECGTLPIKSPTPI